MLTLTFLRGVKMKDEHYMAIYVAIAVLVGSIVLNYVPLKTLL